MEQLGVVSFCVSEWACPELVRETGWAWSVCLWERMGVVSVSVGVNEPLQKVCSTSCVTVTYGIKVPR